MAIILKSKSIKITFCWKQQNYCADTAFKLEKIYAWVRTELQVAPKSMLQERPSTPSHLPVEVTMKRSSHTQVRDASSQCALLTSEHWPATLGSQPSPRAAYAAPANSTKQNTRDSISVALCADGGARPPF
jgi:hypothetical protein